MSAPVFSSWAAPSGSQDRDRRQRPVPARSQPRSGAGRPDPTVSSFVRDDYGVVPVDNVTKYSTTGTPGATNTEVALFGQLTPPFLTGATPRTREPQPHPTLPTHPSRRRAQTRACTKTSTTTITSVASTPGTGAADGGAVAKKPIKAIFQNPQIRFVHDQPRPIWRRQPDHDPKSHRWLHPGDCRIPSYDIALTQPIRIFTGPNQLPESPFMTNSTASFLSLCVRAGPGADGAHSEQPRSDRAHQRPQGR